MATVTKMKIFIEKIDRDTLDLLSVCQWLHVPKNIGHVQLVMMLIVRWTTFYRDRYFNHSIARTM